MADYHVQILRLGICYPDDGNHQNAWSRLVSTPILDRGHFPVEGIAAETSREFKIEPSTPAYGARGTGVRSSTRSIPSPVPGALGHSCPACGIAWPVPCPNETPPASTKTDSDTTRQHHHQPEEESQSAVSAASTTITTAPEIAPTPFSAAIPDPSDNMPKASAKGCVNQGSADPGYACGGWGHLYCTHVTAIDISACAVARRLGFDSVIQIREPIVKNGCPILPMRE
ncbi:uncharacterized protein BO95DRAFT_429935 [Aspergillus brunneoviolaceus CBS 621.78]|uniref:Uncharacterized protein n=1 Tax=Aspergillus brunneoviolaceus CBS 621.78 TaxID=1450534 RepID=A0ACD1GF21_9EURO|nr:hypothetical protein BO95DRAFT_429935 [Aspergillus brunneoviolaceus CBS 621.78]RAH47894.1 hypothetical protein BO95DRAFT_429935 [Aspergillus brunneoviolaceus CBS 621.78]